MSGSSRKPSASKQKPASPADPAQSLRAATAPPQISVRGARTHNLRNIDLEIPRQGLVVVTGVSGSGKSSLVYETLHALAQRRFLQTLGGRVRQWLEQWPPPPVTSVTGLPPTVCLDQQRQGRNPRSTLATLTEIQHFLGLFFARAGVPHCPTCAVAIQPQSPRVIAEAILAGTPGSKLMLLAPLVRQRTGSLTEELGRIVQQGLVRVRIDGELHEATSPPALDPQQPHALEAIVDRLILKPGLESRLDESLALTLKLSEGVCIVATADGTGWRDQIFSSRSDCPQCGFQLPEIEPRTFSFYSPQGACPTCQGLGTQLLEDGARVCPACQGSRLGPVPAHVTYRDWSLPQLSALSVREALSVIRDWLDPAQQNVAALAGLLAEKLLPPVQQRLELLAEIGLDYLTLDRSATTLSGGEYQRARLTGCLGSGLLGVCYLLDEPTAGLHPTDTDRLLHAIRKLRAQGAGVLLVEHDLDVIRQADYVIDLGPGAGTAGGQVLAAGTPAELMQHPASITGAALREHPLPVTHHAASDQPRLRLTGACRNNLRRVAVEIPTRQLVCVTGVSGSGKSTLVFECLVPLVRQALGQTTHPPEPGCGQLANLAGIERLVQVDQTPLGRGGRACPATSLGLWDRIRRLLAQTRESKLRGFSAQRFSLLHASGRCPACHGQGIRARTAGVLGQLPQVCPTCHGKRFQPSTLAVKFRGKSAADLLDLSIAAAAEFFANFAPLKQMLDLCVEIGLGHLTLGQPSSTLSGGEAQRIKLAAELGQETTGPTLFVLDEPTSGLHQQDVMQFLSLLQRLVDQGHTVLVVEHHPTVWEAADWLIDLGPGAGPAGGLVVAQGSQRVVMAIDNSLTGQWLRGRVRA